MSRTSPSRLISMSRSGRFVAIRRPSGIGLVDALGASPQRSLRLQSVIDFACVGSALWVIEGDKLRRYNLRDGDEKPPALELEPSASSLMAGPDERGAIALVRGASSQLVAEVDDELVVSELNGIGDGAGFATTVGGRRVLSSDGKFVRIAELGRGETSVLRMPQPGSVLEAAPVLGGRAMATVIDRDDGATIVVFQSSGALIHQVELPKARAAAIASTRGMVVIATLDHRWFSVDLRFGRVLGERPAQFDIDELCIDANGHYLALAHFDDDEALRVKHVTYADLFGGRTTKATSELPDSDARDASSPGSGETEAEALPAQAAATESDRADERGAQPVEVPRLHLAALGAERPAPRMAAVVDAEPYVDASEHLDDLLDMVAAGAAAAIADAWDSGRLSLPSLDPHPFEREVMALVGNRASDAPEQLQAAQGHRDAVTRHAGLRQRATLATGRSLPIVELQREFGLSNTAVRVLLHVAAPAIAGDVARLYGVLANDEHRPICDRHLIELILCGASDRRARHAVARELAPDAPLLRYGLVRTAPHASDHYLFAALNVSPALIARLRGDDASTAAGSVTQILRSTPDRLDELALPDVVKREMVLALARRSDDGEARIVLRGRTGTGRRTTLAALAARAGKLLAVIHCERMPRQGRRLAEQLAAELKRAMILGAVPCLTGIEVLDPADGEGMEMVRAALRAHPGPIAIRTSPEHEPPLDPGYLEFTIPALTEGDRLEFWRSALARRGLEATGVEALASRFRIGPGTIETVIENAIARRDADPDSSADATADLDASARQHIQNRLGSVATRINRRARWEQVALPNDVIDSIREFLGRVKHRRKVYEEWGYDARMSSSRGLTALFHGPPGTGKSMVAGLIARELNLDLYRVDLAQITSKWIGETEKNLSEVFDAAEDGQCVILFDEADSLFAKRTEVKSSVDRYANLEVNYLLQRLDTFEGVAILTTNLEGSLDQAFKRRLSLRLAFPFPDEEMRVRLWVAHVPPEVPTAGDFDFDDLAKRYPMSGGYIRNSALRAAFLAAQEGEPLSQQHIERAIHLEYREMGKLSTGGRIE